MTLGHGQKIATDGLVFAYDMNPIVNGSPISKSWRGAPTTNIISSPGIGSMAITYTYVSTDNGWMKYSISGTWANGTYPFSFRMNSATLTGGVAYSSRCLLKTNVLHKYASFGGLNYVNDPNMVSSGTSTVNNLGADKDGLIVFESKREGFIYSTGYANPTTTQTGYVSSRPLANGTSFDSNTDFVWVKETQVEQGTFCTPYVSETRSNTQALLDWTGNQTLTVSNLQYNTDGTFEFNGSTSVITMPNNSSLNMTSQLSIESWVNFDGNSGDFIFEKGNVNTQYSLFSHGSDVVFRTYHSGDGSYHTQNPSKSSVGVVNGTPVHILATYDGSNKKIYINGDLKNTVAKTGDLVTTTPGAAVGRFGGTTTGYYFDGKIYSVKVYNRALTATEVARNFEALRGRYGI